MDRPLVIFDFDGTLCNSIEYGIILANKYAKRFNYEPLENFEDVRKQSAVNYIFSKIKWYYIPFWAYVMKKDIQKNAHSIKLYENIQEQLKEISTFAEIGIISGGKKRYIETVLITQYAKQYISFIHPNKGTKKHKILKRYKFRNVIHIGDDIEDIRSSNKLKIKSVAVTWGTSSKEILKIENPTKIIDSPSELSNTIKSILAIPKTTN